MFCVTKDKYYRNTELRNVPYVYAIDDTITAFAGQLIAEPRAVDDRLFKFRIWNINYFLFYILFRFKTMEHFGLNIVVCLC